MIVAITSSSFDRIHLRCHWWCIIFQAAASKMDAVRLSVCLDVRNTDGSGHEKSAHDTCSLSLPLLLRGEALKKLREP